MPHKPWKLRLSFWSVSLAWAVVTFFTFAADSHAQETLTPHAPPILHSFLDSANVYPESVTVDQPSGSSAPRFSAVGVTGRQLAWPMHRHYFELLPFGCRRLEP